jgi:MFS family permease
MKAPNEKVEPARGLKSITRALHHRNFRLFFGGQSISLIGTWMQRIALAWLVYRLTNSAFLLGFVGFSSQIPTFLLTPFAGVLVDRWNRHRMLVATQALAMVQALILSVLVLTATIRIWHIIGLSLVLGIINAFDIPARQAFIVDMVEKREDLGNAIALNSSMVNGARLLGPSVAGILIAGVGEGTCFLINSLSYLPVIAALLAMKIARKNFETERPWIGQGLKDGFIYTFGFAPIRAILLLLGLVSLMGMPYVILMPVFAKDVLHGGPHALGFLMGTSGVGALVGALYLASRKSVLGLGKLIPMSASIFGIGLIAFSLSHVLVISLLFILMVGFGQMVQMASSNTVLQTIVDDDKRGRAMSFYTMAFMGMAPFGSLLAGFLASKIGAPGTLIVGGIACLLGSACFAKKLPSMRQRVRPIYVKMGIIPEIASGIQTATESSLPNRNPD